MAYAIAHIEVKVGAKLGIKDRAGMQFTASGDPEQLDCVDEAVNTTTYLRLIAERGLLRWHRAGLPANRLLDLVNAHNTAVVTDTSTGIAYAVDSWFYDNGTPAVVLPLATWRAGWDPLNGDTVPPDPGMGEPPAQTAGSG